MAFLKHFFSSDQFMPHGTCYLWNPGLIWLHVISDSLIALSYLSIPFALLYFTRKRRDLPFRWMFLFFGVFIMSCGFTHAMDVWTVWHPDYWLSGAVKAVCAAASVPAAILLVRLIPNALAIPSPDLLRAEIAVRKRAELALRQANDDLAKQSEELEGANKELEAFTYSVSHDLRAPLRHVDGFSKLLMEESAVGLSDDARRYLSFVREGVIQMGQLVDDLLNLARVGRRDLSMQVTGLKSLADDVAAELSRDNPSRTIDWRIRSLPFVECDAALMKQVFMNLLANAVKYSRPRECTVIEVGVQQRNGQAVFFVRDNGVGFDMKYADKLFGVFQRLHREEDFEGTGVGLATVQRIIHKHGGQVWADAALNQGATFYFTLPRVSSLEARAAG